MKKKPYALVVGGTGMLEKVCHWLVDQDYFVSVINRHEERFQEMVKRTKQPAKQPERFHPLTLDYHDGETLQSKIQEAVSEHGVPDLVVSWIHSSAPEALPIIMKHCETRTEPWKLLHIQGSSSFFVKENTPVPENCQYRRVYLGFVVEDNQSRWLTHHEISNGVIKVLQKDYKETVVGTLKPWHKRPG
ncbi:short-chain dehydrogenase [Ornithinibacillus halophilus]|uniref:Short chain dehydrogenase n=1 Tax=Ornithinibacillus halophilus TaxID=930117 RepID=A0A1M5JHM8_9BACI|nr:short-chain dehydrogenase [Ornithinibacillus halophilus]SHG39533.1 hypothetical protein SAMN05216225_103026 [Ornithinibacillus halophilus]